MPKPARLIPAGVENSVDAVGNSTNRGVVINLLHKNGNVKCVDIIKPRFVGYAENDRFKLYNSHNGVVIVHRIRELRQKKGMKQAELASILQCSPTTVSNYEVGIRDIDSETVCRLCDVFGCTADYLLGRSELPTNEISDEEAELVLAFRSADDRAREMVRLALAPFIVEAITAESAK